MKSLEELRDYYDQHLKSKLDALEIKRLKLLKTQKIGMRIMKGVCYVIAISVIPFAIFIPLLWAIVVICFLIPYYVKANLNSGFILQTARDHKRKTVKLFHRMNYFFGGELYKEYKKTVVKSIVEFVDEDYRYRPDEFISERLFTQIALYERDIPTFPITPDKYSSYFGEDCIEGIVKDEDPSRVLGQGSSTPFKCSELIVQVPSTRENEGGVDLFRGIFYIADFHKNFTSSVRIVSKSKKKMFLNKTSQKFGNIVLEKVILEDSEFEKKFDVYANDAIEARYILTPSFMTRVKDYMRETDHGVRIGFEENKIFMAIETPKDLFKLELSKTLKNFEIVKEYYHNLRFVTEIIHTLRLNVRIWSRE
jgi:hypothetical protein